jgi:hypothetical protein
MPARVAPQYDIVDERLGLIARAQLRAKSRVVGFGRQSVFVVRTDDDDLEYLEKYQLVR